MRTLAGKIWLILLISCLSWIANARAESVEVIFPGLSAADCPNKIVDVKTIEGTYLGWKMGNVDTIGIKTDGAAQPVYIQAKSADAQKFFGQGTGKLFSVTYETRQYWWDYQKFCSQFKILKSARLLK